MSWMPLLQAKQLNLRGPEISMQNMEYCFTRRRAPASLYIFRRLKAATYHPGGVPFSPPARTRIPPTTGRVNHRSSLHQLLPILKPGAPILLLWMHHHHLQIPQMGYLGNICSFQNAKEDSVMVVGVRPGFLGVDAPEGLLRWGPSAAPLGRMHVNPDFGFKSLDLHYHLDYIQGGRNHLQLPYFN